MGKFNEIIEGEKPVLVDFYADWCGPCKALAPIIKTVKSTFKDEITILKVDVDKNQNTAAKYGIRGVPTLILFRKGQIVWRQSGVLPAEEISRIIRQHV